MAPPSQELEPPINPERFMYDYSAAATRQSLVESRQRPGIDRIDIAHIHDVIELAGGISHIDEARHETYPVLAELREQGTISAIGVGTQVNRVLTELGEAADFSCFLVACRYTLLDQSALDEVLPICVRKNISVVIGSPYNTGILHDPKPDSTFDFVQAPGDLIEKAMSLKAACSRYDIPLPAAAIQFPFGHPAVAQVLTGAVRDRATRKPEAHAGRNSGRTLARPPQRRARRPKVASTGDASITTMSSD
jgi:aryl-alcohol dehydrogenase-like predicted oxidoreductase